MRPSRTASKRTGGKLQDRLPIGPGRRRRQASNRPRFLHLRVWMMIRYPKATAFAAAVVLVAVFALLRRMAAEKPEPPAPAHNGAAPRPLEQVPSPGGL